MTSENLSEEDWREAVEGIRSYLRNAPKSETLDPSSYTNPFTKKPFESEQEIRDYWSDLLGKMFPLPPTGP